MTLPELLKEAYNRRDWAIIEEAYAMLTGAQLSNGSYAEDEVDDSESRWNAIQDAAKGSRVGDTPYAMPTSPNGDKKPCRTEPIDVKKNKINTFHDDRTEALEDRAVDRKLTSRPLVPRTRGEDMTDVNCRKCGNRYRVSKALVAGKFLCDRCIGGNR